MKKSYLHAVYAALYIVGVVLLMTFGLKGVNEPFAPFVALSLFVFSAAVMGYFFVSQPIMLYIDGKKKEAVRFFGETVLAFGIITFAIIVIAIVASRYFG